MPEPAPNRLVVRKTFTFLADPPKLSAHVTKGVLSASGAIEFDVAQKRWIDTVNTGLRIVFDQLQADVERALTSIQKNTEGLASLTTRITDLETRVKALETPP